MMTPTLDYAYIKVKIQNPVKEASCSGYISYEINLETNDPCFTLHRSSTRRRYSDFRVLHAMLSKQFAFKKLPPLPPKSPFQNSFSPKFIEKRRVALEEFIAKLLTNRVFLSSRCLHLFLQTPIPMITIKEIIEGKVPDIVPYRLSDNRSECDLMCCDAANEEENESQDDLDFEDANDSSLECSSSLQNIKKVSFCDQVTVAEIHVQ